MKIIIAPDSFRAALAVASSAVKTRSSAPVLENVLIAAHVDGGVTLEGTDTETRAWHTVAADVLEAGSVTLPPKPLSDFLEACSPREPITLTVDGKHKAELVSGRTRVRMAGIDPEFFPTRPTFESPLFDTTMAADVFAVLVKSVAHAVLPKPDRPTLFGILFQVSGGTLSLAAADGGRLAVRTVPADAEDGAWIPQGAALAKAARMLSGATSARLMVDDNASHLVLDTEDGCCAIKLIEGQFPDYARIIPKDSPVSVTVHRESFRQAMKLVTGIDKVESGHRANLSFGLDSIEISASGGDYEQVAETAISATLTRGEPLRVGFNERHLRDALDAFDTETVTVEMTDGSRPVLIADGTTDRSLIQILMPLYTARPTAPAATTEARS